MSSPLNRRDHQYPIVVPQLMVRPVGAADYLIVDRDGNALGTVHLQLFKQRFHRAPHLDGHLLVVENNLDQIPYLLGNPLEFPAPSTLRLVRQRLDTAVSGPSRSPWAERRSTAPITRVGRPRTERKEGLPLPYTGTNRIRFKGYLQPRSNPGTPASPTAARPTKPGTRAVIAILHGCVA